MRKNRDYRGNSRIVVRWSVAVVATMMKTVRRIIVARYVLVQLLDSREKSLRVAGLDLHPVNSQTRLDAGGRLCRGTRGVFCPGH